MTNYAPVIIRFRKGQKVRDKQDGRIGMVKKSAKRVVLVNYPDQHEFMSMEVGYVKTKVADHLEHYYETRNAQADR